MCPAVEPDWTNVRAPSLAEFEAMATAAYEAMPEPFKALCGEVVMQVVNLPTDDVLQRLGVTSPFDLLGLFEGIGLAQAPLPETGQPPNTIWLYRRAILDYWAEHEETLGSIVSHVLVHEIGHHFGLSDEDIARVEAEAE